MLGTPRTPDEVVDLANAFFASRALLASARTGVFAALAGGPRTAAEVARERSIDARATDLLLRALVSLGLVELEGDRFRPSPLARECLLPGSPRDLTGMLLLDADTFESWTRLEESLASGLPIEVSSRAAADGARDRHRAFIRAMRSTALGNAPIVAAKLDLAGLCGRSPRTLIDIGAGPGTYALEFCRRWADLRATCFDLAETVEIARAITAEDAPPAIVDRMGFRAGDFHRDDLGGPYDVAWASHIVHGHPEETLAPLLSRIAATLAPGGVLAVHDFVLDETRTAPRFGALFALNMLVMSDRGRTYSFPEIRALLHFAGLRDVALHDLGEPRGIAVVTGRTPTPPTFGGWGPPGKPAPLAPGGTRPAGPG